MKIRPQVEEVSRGDLTRHHRSGGTALLGGRDEAAELSDAHPDDLVDKIGKRRIGFPLEGSGHNLGDAGFAGSLGGKPGVGTIAGDQKECLGLLHDPEGYL